MRCRCCNADNAMRYTAPSGDVEYYCIDCRHVIEYELREDQADIDDLGHYVEKARLLKFWDENDVDPEEYYEGSPPED